MVIIEKKKTHAKMRPARTALLHDSLDTDYDRLDLHYKLRTCVIIGVVVIEHPCGVASLDVDLHRVRSVASVVGEIARVDAVISLVVGSYISKWNKE